MFDSPFMTIFTAAEGTLTFAYLGLIGYLIWYLRRTHTAMWIQLGPWTRTMNPFDIVGQFRLIWTMWKTIAFIWVTFQYRTLNDSRVTRLIWSIRILFLVVGFSMPVHSMILRHTRGLEPHAAVHIHFSSP
jgi:hypothetical protein